MRGFTDTVTTMGELLGELLALIKIILSQDMGWTFVIILLLRVSSIFDSDRASHLWSKGSF
jgi:hypothetical protein